MSQAALPSSSAVPPPPTSKLAPPSLKKKAAAKAPPKEKEQSPKDHGNHDSDSEGEEGRTQRNSSAPKTNTQAQPLSF